MTFQRKKSIETIAGRGWRKEGFRRGKIDFLDVPWTQGVIMPLMWWIIFREVLVLGLCLALFPLAIIVFLVHGDSASAGVAAVLRGVFSRAWSAGSPSLGLAFQFIAPYLLVQCVRGVLWAQRSLTGRRWAHLYFAVLLTAAAVWSFSEAWDLFYFMYALGDMPGELIQFFELQGRNVLIVGGSVVLGIHSFRIFLDPTRKVRDRK